MDEFPRITELRKKLEKDPGSRLFAQLAEELRKAGQFDEAIVEARAGLERHPNYPSARLTLARALLDSGRPEDARSELQEIVKAAPDNILASRLLADAFDALGKPEQAVLQYERTLRLSPDDKTIQAKITELRERLDPAPTLDLRGGPPAPLAPPQRAESAPPPPPAAVPPVGAASADETVILTSPTAPPPLDRDLASGTLSGSLNVSDLVGISAPEGYPMAPGIPSSERAAGLDETIGTGELPALDMPDDAPDSEPAAATSSEEAEFSSAEPIEDGPEDVGAQTLPLNSVTLADLYLQQGLKAEATAVLSQVLKTEPENKEARQKFDEVSRSGKAAIAAEAPEPEARTPRTPAAMRAETIASLNAFLAAVERETIKQRASERGAL